MALEKKEKPTESNRNVRVVMYRTRNKKEKKAGAQVITGGFAPGQEPENAEGICLRGDCRGPLRNLSLGLSQW